MRLPCFVLSDSVSVTLFRREGSHRDYRADVCSKIVLLFCRRDLQFSAAYCDFVFVENR